MTKTKRLTVLLLLILAVLRGVAGNLDDIRQALEAGSVSQVQEKVYVHTDNTCYFVGDTLWYKAYVVRADNLCPTDMSRILYVELLNPDGLLVERQNIIISPNGHTCGQFVLEDSLYSGYYELRAYTRWQLNFNVRHHRYSTHDTWLFYNKQMAADYFRIWDGLYSRVLPVYGKPETTGDFDVRRMYQRPKTRLPKQKKDELLVNFFPEGGHLVQGVENRVAFEVTDQHGEAVNISGTVKGEGTQDLSIRTEYMGRGLFHVVPDAKRLKAYFTWHGKNYQFDLPKAETRGAVLQLENGTITVYGRQLASDKKYAVSVLCRGVLSFFQEISFSEGKSVLALPVDELPSGVCDVTLFDDDGSILADRLFFVNHHENDEALITAPIVPTKTYEPYERIELPVQCQGVTTPTTFSLAIRDTRTDEPSYDDNNLLTSLLLSSELKGFIAYPSYYFEKDDEQHRRHLDLLMMVQGWRKYKWNELSDTARQMRYQPEVTTTVEGSVYKMLNINEVEPDEVGSWQDGVGFVGRKSGEDEMDATDPFATDTEESVEMVVNSDYVASANENAPADNIEFASIGSANDQLGVNHGNLRHEVLVEAEIMVDGQFAGSIQKTENGRFLFQIPPFYGAGYLNMKAYNEKDSVKKNMASRKDAKVLDEDAFPDYYVKRDVFFPMFTHQYNFYEKHQPDISVEQMIDTLSELSMENDVYQLGNVNVKGRRRGLRSIDWKKPAYVLDAYDMYNEITDRGLSFGKLDMRQFPVQVCRYLFGNMNRYNSFRVDGRIDGHTYYRNYSPVDQSITNSSSETMSEFNSYFGFDRLEQSGQFRANRTPQSIYKNLKLKRLQDIRVFSDYEPREEDSLMEENRYRADATVELVTIPDDGVQVSFRDRHLVLQGFNEPFDFYQPDYSERQPSEPKDYRRTLYWNPNACTDEEGRFTATFYNNSTQTRIKMSAAGVTPDGRLLHSR